MLRALAYKELRETLGIVAIVLAVYLWFVSGAIGIPLLPWNVGYRSNEIPFASGGFISMFGMISGGLALALGFRQSVGESARGTFLLLLHRSASRRQLIGTKLLVGAGLLLACSALPILGYALWAATPGTHASPFEWSMTLPAWQLWLTMPMLYLAAFLSGMRPARWVGTRLLPTIAVLPLLIAIQYFPWWWLCGLGALVVTDALLASTILFVAQTRDY